MFKQRVEYDAAEFSGDESSDPIDTEVVSGTALQPHPTKKLFLTVGSLFVRIYDSRTGELLQTVVHPLIRVDSKGKSRMTHGNTVESADWTKDGRALYVFSANHTSVSLWKLIE